MNLQPIICKLCKAIIQEPPMVLGDSAEVLAGRRSNALKEHYTQATIAEKKTKGGPHIQAGMAIAMTAEGFKEMMLYRLFELPEEWLGPYEAARFGIHEMTRKVKMSDADLAEQLRSAVKWASTETLRDFMPILQDLRDRYEGLGKYAPAQPQPAAPGPQMVKP